MACTLTTPGAPNSAALSRRAASAALRTSWLIDGETSGPGPGTRPGPRSDHARTPERSLTRHGWGEMTDGKERRREAREGRRYQPSSSECANATKPDVGSKRPNVRGQAASSPEQMPSKLAEQLANSPSKLAEQLRAKLTELLDCFGEMCRALLAQVQVILHLAGFPWRVFLGNAPQRARQHGPQRGGHTAPRRCRSHG